MSWFWSPRSGDSFFSPRWVIYHINRLPGLADSGYFCPHIASHEKKQLTVWRNREKIIIFWNKALAHSGKMSYVTGTKHYNIKGILLTDRMLNPLFGTGYRERNTLGKILDCLINFLCPAATLTHKTEGCLWSWSKTFQWHPERLLKQ